MTTATLLSTLLLATITAAEPTASPPPSGTTAEGLRGPVILDFHADWCGPCQTMRPRVDELTRNRYPVQSIDVDDHPELAERFRIEGVPTFVVVDAQGREVARREGLVETRELADLYRDAARPTPVQQGDASPSIRPASDGSAPRKSNPDPWATVVRITVKDRGSLGFGSGTVIESTPEEAIILTCAHIFSVKGRQPRPDQFNLPVLVELFDGKLGGPGGQTVRPLGKPIPGEVIDYDFDRDVALVRIRPGQIIPTARVVPPRWKPQARMGMYTVGCSHGEDATAWNTVIFAPSSRYQVPGKRNYSAIECLHSPKQGRSGGGLFTEDGFVAGVCNFAFDPSVGRGLYASPDSIYAILDDNGLSRLYDERAPRGPRLDFAANPAPGPADPDVVYRGQNAPGEQLAGRSGNERMLNVDPIIVPRPEFLGIELPDEPAIPSRELDAPTPAPAAGRASHPGRSAWTPVSPGGPSTEPPPNDPRSITRRPSQESAGSAPTSAPTRRSDSRSGWTNINNRGG